MATVPCVGFIFNADKGKNPIKSDGSVIDVTPYKGVTFHIDNSTDNGKTWTAVNYGSKPRAQYKISLLWPQQIRITPYLNGNPSTFTQCGITGDFYFMACKSNYQSDDGTTGLSDTGLEKTHVYIDDEFKYGCVRKFTKPLTISADDKTATFTFTTVKQSVSTLPKDIRANIYNLIDVKHRPGDGYTFPIPGNWDEYTYDDDETNPYGSAWNFVPFYWIMADPIGILSGTQHNISRLPKFTIVNNMEGVQTDIPDGSTTFNVTDVPTDYSIATKSKWVKQPTVTFDGTKDVEHDIEAHSGFVNCDNSTATKIIVANSLLPFDKSQTKVTLSAEGDYPVAPKPPIVSTAVNYPAVYTIKDSDLPNVMNMVIQKETIDQNNDIHIQNVDMSSYIANFYKFYGDLNPTSEQQIYVGYVATGIIGSHIENKPYEIDMGQIQIPNDSSISQVQVYLPFYGLETLPNTSIGKTISATYTVNIGSGSGLYSIKANDIQIVTVQATDGYKYPFKFTGSAISEYSTSSQVYGGLTMYALLTYDKNIRLTGIGATKQEADEIRQLVSSGIEE